jgi:hypothetical protein
MQFLSFVEASGKQNKVMKVKEELLERRKRKGKGGGRR